MIGKDTMLNMIRQAVAVENGATIEKLNVLLDLLSKYLPDISKIKREVREGKIIKLNEREVGRMVREYT